MHMRILRSVQVEPRLMSFRMTHVLMLHRIKELQSWVEQSRTLLASQESRLAQLARARMSRDAIIDLCLLVIANVLTHTPMVSWPVEILAVLVRTVPLGSSPIRRRIAAFLATLTRLGAAAAAFRAMRK